MKIVAMISAPNHSEKASYVGTAVGVRLSVGVADGAVSLGAGGGICTPHSVEKSPANPSFFCSAMTFGLLGMPIHALSDFDFALRFDYGWGTRLISFKFLKQENHAVKMRNIGLKFDKPDKQKIL